MARPLRFTFILALAAIGTGLAAVGGWRFARASAPVNGPIILISIDTLRADHLPAYGYRKVKTPAIDALAADSTVFERAYSHSPQTLPATVSLLSGRLPFETGVRDNIGFVVKPGERLLSHMLRERGYVTAGIVSAYTLGKETGIGQGFDYFDAETPEEATETTSGRLERDGAESEKVAERWLDQQGSARVFLFLHLYEPHKPYAPPPLFAEYDPYDGEIAYVDEIVGRLIRHLKSHQLYDRSTIILLSDHGEGLGDHGETEHGLFLYEEVVRVPLMVKQSGGLGGGRRIGDVVQLIDLAPTILDLAKAPIPSDLRGRSLRPTFEGTGRPPARIVYSESMYGRYHFGWAGLVALTSQEHRYVLAPKEELYNLESDPGERVNLAPEREQDRLRFREQLDRLLADTTIHEAQSVSADRRERLDALGYVGSHVESDDASAVDPVDPKDKAPILEAYRRAGDLVTQRRFAPAIAELQRVAHENPTWGDAWRQLGDVLVRAGRLEQAAAAYERSASLTPGDSGALVAAARSRFRLGRLEEARRDAEKAAGEAPAPPSEVFIRAHELLARIAIARKDHDRAREHAVSVQRAESSVPMLAYVEGLVVYSQGRYDDALAHFLEAGAAQRNQLPLMDLHFYTAETLGRLARWDEAVAEYTRELKLFPHNLPATAGLAVAYREAGRPEDAERALIELTGLAPTPEGYGLAARAWTTMGQGRRAEALRAEGRIRFRADPSLNLLSRPR